MGGQPFIQTDWEPNSCGSAHSFAIKNKIINAKLGYMPLKCPVL